MLKITTYSFILSQLSNSPLYWSFHFISEFNFHNTNTANYLFSSLLFIFLNAIQTFVSLLGHKILSFWTNRTQHRPRHFPGDTLSSTIHSCTSIAPSFFRIAVPMERRGEHEKSPLNVELSNSSARIRLTNRKISVAYNWERKDDERS